MVIGLLADLHCDVKRRFNDFLDHVDNSVEVFLEECAKRNVEKVIIAGDIFESKQIVATQALLRINNIIRSIANDYELYLIPGNHDLIKDNDVSQNLLDNYKSYKNVTVINQYYCLMEQGLNIHLLPYYNEQNIAKYINMIYEAMTDTKKNILISHFGVSGFTMHESAKYDFKASGETIGMKDLSSFDKVFLGHYHGHQQINNITYISAPFQSKMGDEYSKHGFVFFDTETLEHEFVENTLTPKFITIDLNKENLPKILELQNHFIRINLHKPLEKENYVRLRAKLLLNNYDVVFNPVYGGLKQIASIENFDTIVFESPEDLITNFVNQMDEQHLPDTKEYLLGALFN